MIEGIHELLRQSRQNSLLTPEGRVKSISGHRTIIDAIEQRDHLKAGEAMLKHVSDVEALAKAYDRSRSRLRR
jgi:DNA-binding FadR family transcriptional regulator